MKIIEGGRHVLAKHSTVDPDGIITETVEYVQLPDKKILERDDRFIVTKADGVLIKKNHVFMVTTVGENQHNIISVDHGNVYYGEPASTIEELSQWIIEDFEDFKVVPWSNALNDSQKF